MVEMCYKTHTTTVNPIIDWTDGEVWEFLKQYNIPYCTLYDEGFKRLGCIGCPMGSKEQREREFERYPKYKNLYMIAFQKMVENRGGVLKQSEQTSHKPQKSICKAISQRSSASRVGGGQTSLYPYAKTRADVKDFSDMTPEEIIEWWID